MKIHRPKAFTLIELLVVIAIIWFIGVAASKFNFSRLSQNERLNIQVLQINNVLQEIKNNALIGRWVGTQTITPDAWKVDISQSASWTITSSYTLDNQATWIAYSESWKSENSIFMSELYCEDLTWTRTTISNVASLIIVWNTIKLVSSSCNPQRDKYLWLTLSSWLRETQIKVSSISWVIESN